MSDLETRALEGISEGEAAADAVAAEIVSEETVPAEAEEVAEELEEGDEEAEEEAEEEAVNLADADAMVELDDGETVTVEELRKMATEGGLRQADYTRKTQEVAEERKALQAERGEWEAEKGEIQEWFGNMHDPQVMEYQLAQLYPQSYQQMVQAIVGRHEEERDLPESQRALLRRNRELEMNAHFMKQGAQKPKPAPQQDTRDLNQEVMQKFRDFAPGSLQEAGLWDENDSDHNARMVRMLGAELAASHGEAVWDESTFKAAAKSLGELLDSTARRNVKKLSPEELEAALGDEGVKNFRKAQVAKVKAGKSVPRPPTKSGGGGKAKPKAETEPKKRTPRRADEFFDSIREGI